MKKNLHKNWFGVLKSQGILAIASSMVLVSCGAQVGGYSETDGVYYDPSKDTLPQGVITNDTGNQVGDYYNYDTESSIIANAEENVRQSDNRFNDWSSVSNDSDWGNFTGTDTYYNDYSWNNWGWGSPWGWNSWYGYNPFWGWGNRWNMGFSWGWGSSWGWNNWYGYNPYWNYGFNNWGWGNPYWGGGYYGGYYGGYNGNNWYHRGPNRRSGANGRLGYINNQASAFRTGNSARVNNGFRNNNVNTGGRFNNQNQGIRNNPNGGRFPQNGIYRNDSRPTQPTRSYPSRGNESRPTQPTRNYDNGGSRSYDSGSRSGGFRSDSGGSRSSGSSSGGGMRSGGGGRR